MGFSKRRATFWPPSGLHFAPNILSAVHLLSIYASDSLFEKLCTLRYWGIREGAISLVPKVGLVLVRLMLSESAPWEWQSSPALRAFLSGLFPDIWEVDLSVYTQKKSLGTHKFNLEGSHRESSVAGTSPLPYPQHPIMCSSISIVPLDKDLKT